VNKHNHIKSNLAFSTNKLKQSGFSLIEIMVAALVLSIGVLGVASLQIIGLKGNQHSYMKQQAMSVVQNLTERMRSNKEGVLLGHYLTTDNSNVNCGSIATNCSSSTSNCSSENIADADLHNLICGYKVGTGSRTSGLKIVSANDNNTFVDGKLSVVCTDSNFSSKVI